MTALLAPSEMARDRVENSDAIYASMTLALSLGVIWDLATGHVAAFDNLLTDRPDDTGRSNTLSR